MDVQEDIPPDVTWQIKNPVFQVYFWLRSDTDIDPKSQPTEVGYTCKEYRVRNADIKSVIAWADEYSLKTQSTYTISVIIEMTEYPANYGEVWIHGTDPT